MSLSVPYLLSACVDVAPDATVTVEGRRRSVRDVDRHTADEAAELRTVYATERVVTPTVAGALYATAAHLRPEQFPDAVTFAAAAHG